MRVARTYRAIIRACCNLAEACWTPVHTLCMVAIVSLTDLQQVPLLTILLHTEEDLWEPNRHYERLQRLPVYCSDLPCMALEYYWSIMGSVDLKLQHGRFITFHFYHDVAHSLANDYSKLHGYIWDLTTLMEKNTTLRLPTNPDK